MARPRFHELAPFVEHVAAAIGAFDFVTDGVGQAQLDRMVRELVRSCAQSENDDLRPCTVSLRPMRFSAAANAVTDSRAPDRAKEDVRLSLSRRESAQQLDHLRR